METDRLYDLDESLLDDRLLRWAWVATDLLADDDSMGLETSRIASHRSGTPMMFLTILSAHIMRAGYADLEIFFACIVNMDILSYIKIQLLSLPVSLR
jgi:hypothetical protein